jgi:hypothetical protein
MARADQLIKEFAKALAAALADERAASNAEIRRLQEHNAKLRSALRECLWLLRDLQPMDGQTQQKAQQVLDGG